MIGAKNSPTRHGVHVRERNLKMGAKHTNHQASSESTSLAHSTFILKARSVVDGVYVPSFPDLRMAYPDVITSLPPLRECKHFLNLTNGLEALPKLQNIGIYDASFVRIQSTLLEQGHLEQLMNDLDASFLLALALGHTALVYDFGSRNRKRGAPRAIWYGIEFIRYALNFLWYEHRGRAFLRGHNVAKRFDEQIRGFSQSTKRRLQYFGSYVARDDTEVSNSPSDPCFSPVKLYGVYASTVHDTDFNFYRRIAHHHWAPDVGRECLQEEYSSQNPSGNAAPGDVLNVHKDTVTSIKDLLDMDVFFGGLGHQEYLMWQREQGTAP